MLTFPAAPTTHGSVRRAPFLLQCLNHWVFWALFVALILAGTFALVPAQIGSLLSLPLPNQIPYQPLLILLGVGASVMALLALVPPAGSRSPPTSSWLSGPSSSPCSSSASPCRQLTQ